MTVPAPPDPFEPAVEELEAGARLFRVFQSAPDRHVSTFNPGYGTYRFSFFGDPTVPTLYAAQTEIAAVCESLLHDIPLSGGRLMPEQYEKSVVAALQPTRTLRLAAFHGTGLRRLGVDAPHLTSSPPRTYPQTVHWAKAAHAVGLDGVVWMSARCNTDRSYVLFGDRVRTGDIEVCRDYGRVLATGPDRDWLVDVCAFMKVDVLTRTP